MKTKKEILEYIREHRPWSAQKEYNLIVDMGGGIIKRGCFQPTGKYQACSDQIREAKKDLDESEKSYTQFLKENQDLL